MDALEQAERLAASVQGRALFRATRRQQRCLTLELKDDLGTFLLMEPLEGMVLSRYEGRTEGFALDTVGIGEGLKLNYCTAGRLEVALRDERFLYLAPGDLSAETSTALRFSFPCGFYQGLELFFPLAFLAHPPRFLAEAGIDMADVLASACPARMPNWVRPATEAAANVLGALDEAPSDQWPARERLLVAQLLLIVASEGAPLNEGKRAIYTKAQVAIAQRTCEALCADLACRRSIESIARELGVKPTVCKNLFKGVYGQSVSDFMAARRMDAACKQLAGGRTVADTARAVGYVHPGKFAAAFKARIGMTPRDWRAAAQRDQSAAACFCTTPAMPVSKKQ